MNTRTTHRSRQHHFATRLAATAAAISLLLATAGCALIREDTAPAAQIAPEQIRMAQDAELPQADWPSAQWWKACNDDQLDALVDRALRDSPTMYSLPSLGESRWTAKRGKGISLLCRGA